MGASTGKSGYDEIAAATLRGIDEIHEAAWPKAVGPPFGGRTDLGFGNDPEIEKRGPVTRRIGEVTGFGYGRRGRATP